MRTLPARVLTAWSCPAKLADEQPLDLQITLPTLLPALMERFASREGYVLHDDVLPALQHLKNGGFKLGILSNSDPRTIKVIESLGIVPDYIPDDKCGAPFCHRQCNELTHLQHNALVACGQIEAKQGDLRSCGCKSGLPSRRNPHDWRRSG